MQNNTIKYHSVDRITQNLGKRIRERRLEKNLTQREFAERAGLGYDTYRRFETSGEISLNNLVLCAIALDDVEIFNQLFSKKGYRSIDELLKKKETKKRQRASSNK